MKYTEYHSDTNRKGRGVFYTVLVCCLLAVGAAAWFAARNIEEPAPLPNSSAPYSSIESDTKSVPGETEMPTDETETPPDEGDAPASEAPLSSATEEEEETTQAKSQAKVPVFSMPVEGEVLKSYSDSELQYSATYGDMRLHLGYDLSCDDGAAVSAVAGGNVVSVEESAVYGTVLTIDHGDGISTQYASIKNLCVKEGEGVAAGDVLGYAATVPSECADQSHIHFAVLKDGHYTDPTTLF